MNEYLSVAQQIALRTESVNSPLVQATNALALHCKQSINTVLHSENGMVCTIRLRGVNFEFSSVSDISEYTGAMGISLEDIEAALPSMQRKI